VLFGNPQQQHPSIACYAEQEESDDEDDDSSGDDNGGSRKKAKRAPAKGKQGRRAAAPAKRKGKVSIRVEGATVACACTVIVGMLTLPGCCKHVKLWHVIVFVNGCPCSAITLLMLCQKDPFDEVNMRVDQLQRTLVLISRSDVVQLSATDIMLMRCFSTIHVDRGDRAAQPPACCHTTMLRHPNLHGSQAAQLNPQIELSAGSCDGGDWLGSPAAKLACFEHRIDYLQHTRHACLQRLRKRESSSESEDSELDSEDEEEDWDAPPPPRRGGRPRRQAATRANAALQVRHAGIIVGSSGRVWLPAAVT